jgi:hypothetical protein
VQAAACGSLTYACAAGDDLAALADGLAATLEELGCAASGGLLTAWLAASDQSAAAEALLGAGPLREANIKSRLMAQGSADACVLEYWGAA